MSTTILKCKEVIVPLSLMVMVFISCHLNSGPPGTDTLVKIVIDAASNYTLKRLHAE
jgi:hypothetical protein